MHNKTKHLHTNAQEANFNIYKKSKTMARKAGQEVLVKHSEACEHHTCTLLLTL